MTHTRRDGRFAHGGSGRGRHELLARQDNGWTTDGYTAPQPTRPKEGSESPAPAPAGPAERGRQCPPDAPAAGVPAARYGSVARATGVGPGAPNSAGRARRHRRGHGRDAVPTQRPRSSRAACTERRSPGERSRRLTRGPEAGGHPWSSWAARRRAGLPAVAAPGKRVAQQHTGSKWPAEPADDTGGPLYRGVAARQPQTSVPGELRTSGRAATNLGSAGAGSVSRCPAAALAGLRVRGSAA
jgi:hypothetical protein